MPNLSEIFAKKPKFSEFFAGQLVRDPALDRTVLTSKTKHTKQYTTPRPTHVSSVAPPDSLLAELTRYISFG